MQNFLLWGSFIFLDLGVFGAVRDLDDCIRAIFFNFSLFFFIAEL